MKNIANNLNSSENLKAIHIAWRQLMKKNDASETSSTELDDDDGNVKRDFRWFLSP